MDKYTFHEQVVNLKKFIEDTEMASPERKLKISGMVSSLEVRYELDMAGGRDEMDYMISRQQAIDALCMLLDNWFNTDWRKHINVVAAIEQIPSVQPESRREWYMKGYEAGQKSVQPQRWIPCEERLPEDLEAVNITWVNHEPEPYYHDIKDKNFVATGIHYRDKWYWYSTTCADFLGEYGSNEVEEVDDAVEIIAWMPLPEPYKGGQDE